MVYYDVNGQRFANPYAAFAYAAYNHPHTFPRFDFYDYEFSKYDWSIEPTESWHSLCDTRAHQLRNKYEKLVLCFSGGTDSITIYNTFVRNRIHIDEIYVAVTCPGIDDITAHWHNESILDWVRNNHRDPTTKITSRYLQTKQSMSIVQNRMKSQYHFIDPMFSTHTRYYPSWSDRQLTQDLQTTDNYCLITGHEKPYLTTKNGEIYFTFLDGVFSPVMMRPDIEFFYVTPDLPQLHAKQCHMLIRGSQQLNLSIKQMDHIDNYYLRTSVLGRDQEVSPNTSRTEKIIVEKFTKNFKNIDFFAKTKMRDSMAWGDTNPMSMSLFRDVQDQHIAVHRYFDGWAALQSDQRLIDYMTRQGLLSSHHLSIQSYFNVESKWHRLTSCQQN